MHRFQRDPSNPRKCAECGSPKRAMIHQVGDPAPEKPIYDPPPGAAQTLLYRLMCLLDVVEGKRMLGDIPPPTEHQTMGEGVKVAGGKTKNYEAMGRVGAWAYYELAGDETNATKFRRQVLNIFAQELREGQMLSEGGCSSPHDGMHLASKYVTLYLAIQRKDDEMARAARDWCESFLRYCKDCSVATAAHGPRPLFVGIRIKKLPTSQVREMLFDLSEEREISWPRRVDISTDRFYTAVRAGLLLKKIGRLPRAIGRFPVMYGKVVVVETPDGGKTITMTEPPTRGIAPHLKKEIVTEIRIRPDGSYSFTRLSGDVEEGQ